MACRGFGSISRYVVARCEEDKDWYHIGSRAGAVRAPARMRMELVSWMQGGRFRQQGVRRGLHATSDWIANMKACSESTLRCLAQGPDTFPLSARSTVPP